MSSSNGYINHHHHHIHRDEYQHLNEPNHDSAASTSTSVNSSSIIYTNNPIGEHNMEMYHFASENDSESDQNMHHHLNRTNDTAQHVQHQSVILIVNEDGTSTIKNLVQANSCLIVNENQQLVTNNLEMFDENSCSSSSNESSMPHAHLKLTRHQAKPVKQVNYSAATSTSVVPAISNAEEIFQLLSQKIAKYCQILTDLTNCEVFYKAQLPLVPEAQNSASKNLTPKTSASKYKPKNVVNKNIRSLYWGTHKMLFEHSHGHGLRYEKINGDSLIKISTRSLASDINSLIEELLNMNESNTNPSTVSNSLLTNNSESQPVSTNTIPTTIAAATVTKKKMYKSFVDSAKTASDTSKVEIKDFFVGLERMDDNVFEQYLNKFELVNNSVDNTKTMFDLEDLVEECRVENEAVIYSDEFRVDSSRCLKKPDCNSKRKRKMEEMVGGDEQDQGEEDEEENVESEDLDERTLLERNCFYINDQTELNESEEDLFTCEYCTGHYYKHLTQLKVNFK